MAGYRLCSPAFQRYSTEEQECLQAYEDVLERCKDERDKVQKKTFTKWINQHLMKVRKHVNDLYEDLRDGHNLISLLEVLSGDTLPREKGRMRFHRLQNVQIALDYLKKRQVKLVNIRNDDITDGNPKLTLGLIWTIILHFQISDIHVTGESQDMSAKEKLLLWTQRTIDGYGGIRCDNFTTCWRDGRLFNAVIHRYRPDLIDMNIVAVQSNTANLENAFYVAEKLGVTRLLDPEDVDVSSPDEKSVITYVSSLYDVFPKVPEDGEGINANDVEVKWVEYQNMVNYLIQWIRHHATLMSDRTFPNSPVELKALYNQYLQFKETEIPPKENEKARIKHLYKQLEVWIEFGRVKLPQGYHPNDIEKEWGKLIIAMLEREKTLRPEVDRLEMLQQIATRIQRDSLGCEDKLILAQNALHSDTKRLESGLQLQHEAEIAGYLLESEGLLRQQLSDVQVLLDGKYYQADQIVQRVAKLRDDLIALRNEYSSVYSTGRSLTTEQTKYLMSGITQSLSSGFTQNMNPSLNSGLPQTLSSLAPSSITAGLSHGVNSRMTPTLNQGFPPTYAPGLIQNYMPGVDTSALQNLKLMQIRKPTLKSAIADQNMTEEEVNMNFVQDLLNWVEEMQVQLDRAEWGSDLPSVESHLDNHKNVHKAIEEFESSLREAKMSELQMTGSSKPHYSEKLHKLEGHYSKLLHSSRSRARHLDTLHNVVSRATRELIWLNEKEEEEVAYDWSERVSNLTRKKEYHGALMRELDHKEESMRAVQDMAEQLLVENHPARLTIEAYRAAMQTQWSWILQLCHCVEQHLRENSEYFEFFNDAKEAMDYLKNLKDAVLRKYSCDRSSSLHKLEDLLQESMEEKAQLLQYKSTVASLVGRAKAIIQLKPRNPDSPLKSSIPIKAICDYRQIEITIYKNDECILAGNSHRAKWKVISPSGNEAMVPSVCFTIPPPNKEAIDTANRIEQVFQSVLTLWHESHINMKSVVTFHYLMNEIEAIRASNVSSIKTTLPGEHQQVLSSLRSRFEDFAEDSQESKIFTVSDIGQLEREVNVCRQYYEELLKSAEREEQEESIYNLYISEVRNIRLRLETCEERLIRQIRTPLERDDLHESVFKISEQEKLKKELDRLKDDLGVTTDKCEEFFNQAAASLSVPTLRSELSAVIQNMNHIYSLSSIYLEKLKTINLVLQNTQGAESLVKLYETKLCEEDAATSDRKAIESLVATLKNWRSEVDEKREVFHALEDELQKAKAISDQMFKTHKERDLDFDWHKEKADQLAERWQNVHSQIDGRLRDLDGIGKSLKYYKESYVALDNWITQVEETQKRLQENQPENSKALAKQLHQQKSLVSEIEMKQHKIDECQKYSEQYSASVKDYELQLMTYRAMVDSHQKSPVKRRRMQSSSDVIIQEFMELRARYTALITLLSQYVKFAAETLKRMEEEEKSVADEKKEHIGKTKELLNWVSNVSNVQKMQGVGNAPKTQGMGEHDGRATMPLHQMSNEEMEVKQEQILDALQSAQMFLAKHGDKMSDEEKKEMEEQLTSLQETYNLLSETIVRQKEESKKTAERKVEEKVPRVIAGTIDETTGEVLSIFQSIVRGLVDYDTGISLLETQLILSDLISPELGKSFNLEEAKKFQLIDEHIATDLCDLNIAKTVISAVSLSGLPVIAAFEKGLISEQIAIKILDTQLSSEHLVLPSTGEQLTLNTAFQRNLISEEFFSHLLERQKIFKDLIDPITAERISLTEMLQRTPVHKETGLRLLVVRPQERGKITLKSGRRISILRAAHEGLMERESMFRLLGAQLLSGGIIEPDLGHRLSLEEALKQGLIDQDTLCGILINQVKNGGIFSPFTAKRLTVDEAVQCNLISSSSALLILEAQRGFIGLIWPDTSDIFPISTSLQQGMITNELAHKILNNRQKIAALYIPETSEILSLGIAAEMGIIDDSTATVLTNITLPDKMADIKGLESSCKNASKWLSSYEVQPSAYQGYAQKPDVLNAEEPLPHNPEETKQLFLSFLMINSYMDANTGERLLLFDGDLDEAVSMLLESESYTKELDENQCPRVAIHPNENDLNTSDNLKSCVTNEAENKCTGSLNTLESSLKLHEYKESILDDLTRKKIEHADEENHFAKDNSELVPDTTPVTQEIDSKMDIDLVEQDALDRSDVDSINASEIAENSHRYSKQLNGTQCKETQSWNDDEYRLLESHEGSAAHLCILDERNMVIDHDPALYSSSKNDLTECQKLDDVNNTGIPNIISALGSLNSSGKEGNIPVTQCKENKVLIDQQMKADTLWENNHLFYNSDGHSGNAAQTLCVNISGDPKCEADYASSYTFHQEDQNDQSMYDNYDALQNNGNTSEKKNVGLNSESYDAFQCDVSMSENKDNVPHSEIYDTLQPNTNMSEKKDESYHFENHDTLHHNAIHQCDLRKVSQEALQDSFDGNYDVPLPDFGNSNTSQNISSGSGDFSTPLSDDHQCSDSQQITSDDVGDTLLPRDYHYETSHNVSSSNNSNESPEMEVHDGSTLQEIFDINEHATPCLEGNQVSISEHCNSGEGGSVDHAADNYNCETPKPITSDKDSYNTVQPHIVDMNENNISSLSKHSQSPGLPPFICDSDVADNIYHELSGTDALQQPNLHNNSMHDTSFLKYYESLMLLPNPTENGSYDAPPSKDNADGEYVEIAADNNPIITSTDKRECTSPMNTVSSEYDVIYSKSVNINTSEHNKDEPLEVAIQQEHIPDIFQPSCSDDDEYASPRSEDSNGDILLARYSDTEDGPTYHPEDDSCDIPQQSSSDDEYDTPLLGEGDSADDSDCDTTWHESSVVRNEMSNDTTASERPLSFLDDGSNPGQDSMYFCERNHTEEQTVMENSRQYLETIPEEDTESTCYADDHDQESIFCGQNLETMSSPSYKLHQTIDVGENNLEEDLTNNLIETRLNWGIKDLDAANNNAGVDPYDLQYEENCVMDDVVCPSIDKTGGFAPLALVSSNKQNICFDDVKVMEGPQCGLGCWSEAQPEGVIDSSKQKEHLLEQGTQEGLELCQCVLINGNTKYHEPDILRLTGDVKESELIQQVIPPDISANVNTTKSDHFLSSDVHTVANHTRISVYQELSDRFPTEPEILSEDQFKAASCPNVSDKENIPDNVEPLLATGLDLSCSLIGIKAESQVSSSDEFVANLKEMNELDILDVFEEQPVEPNVIDLKCLRQVNHEVTLSSVCDQVQSHDDGQPGMNTDTPRQMMEPLEISHSKETHIPVSGINPTHIEHLGEIFDSSLAKPSTNVGTLDAEDLKNKSSETVAITSENNSRELQAEAVEGKSGKLDLTTYLKQCAEETKVVKINEIHDSDYAEEEDQGKSNVWSMKEPLVCDPAPPFGEELPLISEALVIVLPGTSESEESKQTRVNVAKETEDPETRMYDQVLWENTASGQFCTHKDALGKLNTPQGYQKAMENVEKTEAGGFIGEASCQVTPFIPSHVLLEPLSSENKKLCFVEQQGGDKGSCMLKNELRNYSDTKALMQNVLKMVSCRDLEQNPIMSSCDNKNEDSDTFPVVPCIDASNQDNPTIIWPEKKSPDLLLDVLKQVHNNQGSTNQPEHHYNNEHVNQPDRERVEAITDMKQELVVTAPELIALQLEQIFQIPLDNEQRCGLEKLMSDLTKEMFAVAQKTEEVKSKEDLLGSEKSEPRFGSDSRSESPVTHYTSLFDSLQQDNQQFKIDSAFEHLHKDATEEEDVLKEKPVFSAEEQCSRVTQKLQEHLTVIQDMKYHLDNQQPISNNLETLKLQLEQLESFETGLTAVSSIVRKELKLSEEFIKMMHKEVPADRLKDLKISHDCLQKAFFVVREMSSKRAKQIVFAVDSEMAKLAVSHQELQGRLQKLSDWITENSNCMTSPSVATYELAAMKETIQFLKTTEKQLKDRKMLLETTAFDIQFFISEHAQDLSPNQCKQLLRLLNTTQRSFHEAQERITFQLKSLQNNLLAAQDLDIQKEVEEQQQEYKEKLQEICDLLTKTENRLIGQQDTGIAGESTAELEMCKMEHEELQKDMQAGASELAEIVKNTEKFLLENGAKLPSNDRAVIEQKLGEAKTKFELLRKRAEESKKELDKAVTTAIKQETEKVAAVEQLEESTHKIERLLDWLTNVEGEAENGKMKNKKIEQNGTRNREEEGNSIEGEMEEVNGNVIDLQQTTETTVDGHFVAKEKDLGRQYQKAKAQHDKLVSQHQDVVIAIQSAQALLEKQGCYLTPEDKETLQKNMKALKVQYETSLAESERKMKLIQSVQDELEKFTTDCNEFESWLRQSKEELEDLEIAAPDFSGVRTKLQRQKSFSEDVISHKGDLRYITISGQRVMDTAKSCSRGDGVKSNQDDIDTSTTCTMVQSKLDTVADHFKSLYSKCNILGNNLKDLVDKYDHYTDVSSVLLSGLQASETSANKRLSEPIAVDPKNLQRQLEETKVLQGQIATHQVAVEKTKKAAEVLLDTRGGLLPNTDEVQTALDDIVQRYDNLFKSVNDRNEKLQITLTRSLSVQDGLDEMLDWLGGVEKGLKEQDQVPLNSAAIDDILSKSIMLEQDIASRQSSINAMNEKVNKFMETADSSTASSLQRKMTDLSKRFTDASGQQKERFASMESLKVKVELFETVLEKVKCFLEKKSQALSENDTPGKDVTELCQYMQETSMELIDHKKNVEVLQQLLEEISVYGLPGDRLLVNEKVNALSKKFKELEEAVREKEEDVSSCQSQMDTFNHLVESLKKWIKSTATQVPVISPTFSIEDLKKPLEDSKVLLEEWTAKAPEVQKLNKKGTSLCSLISAVTSPAKSRAGTKAGRVVSNGEEKPAVSKWFLTNKELTAIQQDMSEVTGSYDDLGVMLNKKVSELQNRLSEAERVQEDMSSMMQWLKQMEETMASWETAPTDSTAVKAQVEQHKAFEAELKQNAGKLQALKDAVQEVLEKYPDVPEAAKWKQMLAQIDSTWDELSHLAAERQHKLEESSNFLAQFQSAEAQLKQWLVEKELMASVLGPLSIDPNMLRTQKKQVQILLKEFESRQPQYELLNSAGHGILNGPEELSPSRDAVREELSAVTAKWDSLTGQLGDRADRIDQAIVKSSEYQSLLKSLSDKLTDLDNKLSSSQAVSTHPDAVKEQLATAREVQQEVKQEATRVEAAHALCEELSALVREEYLKAELTRQLEAIAKPLKETEKKADKYVEHLKCAYASCQQFQQMSKDFQGWLEEKKKEQSQAPPVSAKLDTLLSLIKEQAAVQKALADELATYENISREGESLLQKTQGAERAELQTQLGMLKSDWVEINKKGTEREHKLKECQQKALAYREHVESLTPYLDECGNNLSEIKDYIDLKELENSIGLVKTLEKNVDKQRRVVEMLNSAAESLVNACETDTDVIREETARLNQQVESITEQVLSKRDSLENMAQRLKEFHEIVRETGRQIQLSKEQLQQHDSLGVQACSSKHLTNMQTHQKTLQSLKPKVDLTSKLARELVIEASDAAGVSDLLMQAESLEQDHSAISKQIEDKCSFLETKLQGIGHFQNTIRELFTQFTEFDDELDGMSPVGRNRVLLLAQKEDISNFLRKLGNLIKSNENANSTCKNMLATEASTDLIGIKRDLEALSKQCNKLLDRANARGEQVEGTLDRLEEWYGKLQNISDQLVETEKHEESQGQVGMETDVINQQLNVFQVFQKEEIEPLHVKLQEVNWLGQGLIQSAARNTDTQKLDHDLEEINTRWNTLNKKVAQRAAQLQEALLHCGRFQDALESLLCWLTDTEELIANQKPPSAEFKVVKAQIQEQKLLQRLLDDRKPTVEAIKREGENIAESAEPADKEKTLKQLDLLGHRWDVLLKKAETRNRQLEDISVVAAEFHETFEPLVEWLSTTEKRLANSEPVGTQTPKLKQQISQQKALEDDITTRNKILNQFISVGQSLKNMSSREDKDMVQEILDSCQARYIDIQEKSSRRCDLLQQAHCNAQIFGDDEVELMNWLNESHDKLSKLSVQDYSIDVLAKQHAELLLLQEDILLRKQNVDQAILNGLELLKQTTGDEVVVIQDKLDGIKARYSEITKLSCDVSKNLEQALQLAGQLQATHEELCWWLDEVEIELLSYEAQVPKAEELGQVQQRQKDLHNEAKSKKSLLDSVNTVSSALLELVPWRAREGMDKMVTEDNERYRLVSETLTQKVQEIDAAMLKSQQFEHTAEAELSWIKETEKKIMSLGDIRLEQDQTTGQLQTQKAFTMEILRHKDSIDQLVTSADKIMCTCTEEEKLSMKNKLEALEKDYDALCQLNSERYLQLERAQSLVSQFWETYEELCPWLEETETIISQFPAPALEYETLKQQQEEIRQLRELIAEHKPHIDKMNKTGPQLLELSPTEGFSIQEKYVTADTLYSKIKEDVKKRAIELDDAISQSSQFHDKIDPMLESLDRIAERLRQPPSISAEVEKIREQLSENKNVSVELEKLQPGYETLKQRGEEMIARSEGADKDISAKAVQDKLDQMVFIWEDIQALTEEREAKLLDVMELAEKFWCDHIALVVTIKDTQDFIRDLEEPGVDPSVVKQQQEAAEAIREEVDGLQEELDVVINLGGELITACGEPDKPVVNKSIDELNSAWDTLNKTWKDRIIKLNEAMQAAVQYQDGLQAIFDWIDIAGSKLDSMPPIGTDLETVKQQIAELKQYKSEAYQQQIEMERLNHQKELLLKKVTDEMEKHAVQDSFTELKHLWDTLEEKIVNRQHKLEGALLALGQFQHALDELLTWLTHTEELLNDQKPVGGDPKAIEIALAKHHVLQNDVLAHESTVRTVKKAGRDLIESSAGEEANSLQSKLEALNQRWQKVLESTDQRRQQLDIALSQAQGFHSEIEDLQQWLADTERQLLSSKPVGGLPETAREQLNTHLELCADLGAKEVIYKNLMQKGQQVLARCADSTETHVEQDLNSLQEKWESIDVRINERKTKLEEALTLATDFHNSLQDFINWLTQAEQTLTMVSPASLILDTVLFQIDEHKVFVTEVNSHRDQIIQLDKTGTHLKYFSQKQDVVLIKNLLISVQSRWENVVQRSVERGRALDDARKRAKQFHEAFSKLMEWLDESENSLDSELEIANDPDKLKAQLATHKEFQKTLGAKHSMYDTTIRSGRSLKEKSSLADDSQKLDHMLSEIRDKWDTVCGKSVERQNKLEEALLFSGQFADALQALIDWLYRVEPQLAEDQPVHGDMDLVMNLIDNHKGFQKELGKRTSGVQALKRSSRELIESSRDDSSWVKVQMQELSTRWETVCALSVSKQTRLEQALRQAEEFHSAVHDLLEWLAEAEQALRFHGALPDDEEALRALIDQHKEFMRKLEEKRTGLKKGVTMGEEILTICHPDSITTIKHWITIIRARFEEVLAWAKQHQQRLAGALAEVLSKQELLEELLGWLQWAETTLNEKDKEEIPEEIDEVKALIAEHQSFMEEMTRKQPDVDKLTKTYKRKAADHGPVQSNIPVPEKGRNSRKRHPTPGLYPTGAQTQIETKDPRVNMLVGKWQQVWLLALERRRNLNDALDRLEELREFANFDFDVWRKKYMRWMNHKKSRVMDFFRRIDKDQDGKITRQEFIEGILSSKFPTSRLEMSAVADIFDRDGDGYIDYYEFVAALHPNKDAYKPLTDADKIEDEVTRQVAKCKCAKRFQVEQIGDNKYRFFLGNQFGDSQQLRLVRILRSTVMVRVGGGWMALDEFLVKNDPCRVHHHGSKMLRSESNSSITTQTLIGWQTSLFVRPAQSLAFTTSLSPAPECIFFPLAKGRTNMELREKFMLPDGGSQSMAAFRQRGRKSRPSSRGASPNRTNSGASPTVQPGTSQTPGTTTPKTGHPLARNYGKPWLANSKTSTPCKTPESPECPALSTEGTPIQGSKLRLPGYLSGKGFQSGEDSSILSTAATRVRLQFAESRKTPSRPDSRAGSKTGSRRSSDASDFDISEIQSVCSDVTDAARDTTRPSPRAGSRPSSGRPSKIPTPQRRAPASKLSATSKR
ncbi:dystonin isoform X4 [Pleurodeles waltl]|uniref:dystonin isoform X4 n=1 Tax=Pleurodeles waltl TaxID=8319 RepID=UPI0037095E0E